MRRHSYNDHRAVRTGRKLSPVSLCFKSSSFQRIKKVRLLVSHFIEMKHSHLSADAQGTGEEEAVREVGRYM
jgi:hypothetical protein